MREHTQFLDYDVEVDEEADKIVDLHLDDVLESLEINSLEMYMEPRDFAEDWIDSVLDLDEDFNVVRNILVNSSQVEAQVEYWKDQDPLEAVVTQAHYTLINDLTDVVQEKLKHHIELYKDSVEDEIDNLASQIEELQEEIEEIEEDEDMSSEEKEDEIEGLQDEITQLEDTMEEQDDIIYNIDESL